MIRTKLDVSINVGTGRQEQRTLLFVLGPAINGARSQTDELVQFQIMTFKKLTAQEAATLTSNVGGQLVSNIEGHFINVLDNGDVYFSIDQRIAVYKKSTFDTVVGETKIKDFDLVKYTLMISQIDYVTNSFDSWDLIEQYKVGDYYGLVSDQLEIITG